MNIIKVVYRKYLIEIKTDSKMQNYVNALNNVEPQIPIISVYIIGELEGIHYVDSLAKQGLL